MRETDWAPDFAPLTFKPELGLDTSALSSIHEQEQTPCSSSSIRTKSSRLHMRAASILSFASTRKEQRHQHQQPVRSRQASSVYMPDIVSPTDDVSASSSDLNAIVSKHTFEEAVAHGFDMDTRAMEYLPQLPQSPSIMDEMKSHLDLDSDSETNESSFSEFGSPPASPILYSASSLIDAHHRQMTLKLTLTPAHIQTFSPTTTSSPPPLPRRHSKLFRWQKQHAFSSRA